MLKFRKYMIWSLWLVTIVTGACSHAEHTQGESAIKAGEALELKYAQKFEIVEYEKFIEIKILNNADERLFTYALIPEGSKVPENTDYNQIIEVPVSNLVVTSTSHLPFLELLKASDRLIGFPNTQYVSSSEIRSRIDQGLVRELGTASGLDFESLVSLNPQLVVTYTSGPDLGELEQLGQADIPAVVNLDFLESTPLGRAEWIKFMGLLLGRYEHADSVFNEIEKNYLELKINADSSLHRPTVFSGIVYGDTWFAPGGNSFVAKFIEDAGGFYNWKEYPTSGSIELSFEAVIDKDVTTEFWIGTGGFTSKSDLQNADPRYAHFQAFKNDRIFNYHKRIGATGGFEYLESGGARPDLVLADFKKILHPDLVPEYQSYFFKRLDK